MIISGRAGDGSCGVGDHSFFLARELSDKVEVYLLFRSGRGPRDEYSKLLPKPNLHLVDLPAFSVSAISKVLKLIREICPTIVHLQYPAREFRVSSFPLLLSLAISHLRKTHLVLTLHEYLSSHPLRKLMSFLICSRAKLIIVPSMASFNVVKRNFPSKAVQIPDGAYFPLFGEARAPGSSLNESRETRVLSFGLPGKTKRLAELLRLMEDLRKTSDLKDLNLTLIGYKQSNVNAISLRSRNLSFVSFLPYQEVESLEKMARKSLLVVFPFNFDTHRSSLINSLALPAPIYCFGIEKAVLREKIEPLPLHPEGSGYEANLSALRDCLLSLRRNFEETGAPILARQRILLETFQMERIANQHLEVYNKVLSRMA